MGLDIKIPIGMMFTLLGIILTILGLLTMGDTELYRQSLGYNINLFSGITMLVFGCFMLFTSRLFKKKKNSQE
jgi:membrane-bound ClpP family serine protease